MVRRVSARNTITIPKSVLDHVGAAEGTYFEVSDDGHRIILTPMELRERLEGLPERTGRSRRAARE